MVKWPLCELLEITQNFYYYTTCFNFFFYEQREVQPIYYALLTDIWALQRALKANDTLLPPKYSFDCALSSRL